MQPKLIRHKCHKPKPPGRLILPLLGVLRQLVPSQADGVSRATVDGLMNGLLPQAYMFLESHVALSHQHSATTLWTQDLE